MSLAGVVPVPAQAPVVTARPLSQARLAGLPLTATVGATGAGPLTFRWKRNGTVIAGASTATLNVPALALADRGWYQVTISNAAGAASSVFAVDVGLSATSLVAWGDGASAPANLGPVLGLTTGAGGGHVLALRPDGTVIAWGLNSADEIYVPAGLAQVVGLAAGRSYSAAVKSDGAIVQWPALNPPPSNLGAVVGLSAGWFHVLALRADGTVAAWGGNSDGQCNVPPGLGDVVAVAAGGFHSLALKADGSIVAWGGASAGQTNVPDALIVSPDATAIAAGTMHSLALRADRTVVAWGQNYSGSTGLPAGLSGVTAIAAGEAHSLALKSDGTVVAWGRAYEHQTSVPAGLSGASDVAANAMQSFALAANTAPAISQPPVGRAATLGDFVELSVAATGTIPLGYQWKRNGAPVANGGRIGGATGARFTIDGITAADAGNYVVEVTNAFASVASSPVAVTVAVPPSLTHRPRSRLATIGESIVFTVGATDPGAMAYRWLHNGQTIAGATTSTLAFAAVTAADRGAYEVFVSNSAATAHSAFLLNVSIAPTANGLVLAWGADDYGPFGPSQVPITLNNVVGVAAGDIHAAALKADGTVVAWGVENYGATAVPAGLHDVVALAAGAYHTLALKADGRVVSWGNYFDQPPPVPPDLRDVVQISARGSNNLALKSDGTVVGWGPYGSPAVPSDLTQVVGIAAGTGHCLAVKSDGTVVAWGANQFGEFGQTNIPAGLTNVVGVAAGDLHSLALKADGTVVAWGRNDVGQATPPEGLSGVIALAAGFLHTAALKADGSVVGWGRDPANQAPATARLGGVVAISAALNYSLGLAAAAAPTIVIPPAGRTINIGASATFSVRSAGAPLPAYQWRKGGVPLPGATGYSLSISNAQASDTGDYTVTLTNAYGVATSSAARLTVATPVAVTTRPRSRLAAMGSPVSFGITAAGATSYQWRHNGQIVTGATGDTLTLPAISLADRGYYEVIVTDAAGGTGRSVSYLNVAPAPNSLVAWGAEMEPSSTSWHYPPADLVDTVAISSGGYHAALRANGTVVVWGNWAPVVPAGLANVIALSAGGNHLLALKDDGTVTVVGTGGYSEQNVPAGLNDVVAVSAYGYYSLALRADGTVVTWGYSASGVPAGLSGVVAIAAGGAHHLALKSDGTVVAWGNNSLGQTNVPPQLGGIVAIAAGNGVSLALRPDGSVVSWGSLATPADLGPVRAIAAGDFHAMALKADGTVAAWGRSDYAQIYVPPGLGDAIAISAGGARSLALVARAPEPAAIVTPPPARSVPFGQNATLTVGATGTPLLGYQWFKDGNAIWDTGSVAGTRTATLTIGDAQESNAGNYAVRVSNGYNTVTSTGAALTVTVVRVGATPAPTVGGSVTLSVNAGEVTGYQWRYRGSPLPGATGATLTLTNLSRGQNGDYDVLLGDAGGGALAAHAYRLEVRPAAATDLFETDLKFAPRLEREGAGSILAMLPLPDGKYLVGGDFIRLGSQPVAYLARLNGDGSLDSGFAAPAVTGPVRAMIAASDGRVVLAGDFAFVDGRRSGGVARLNADLTVDPGFAVGAGFNGSVLALAPDAGGRLLVGGEFDHFASDSAGAIVRLLGDGGRDPTFQYYNVAPVRVVRLQADNRIVIGGGADGDNSNNPTGFVSRLAVDGTFDPTWLPNFYQGYRPNPPAPVHALYPLAGGRWLVGSAFPALYYGPSVVRLNADGTQDPTFALDVSLRTGLHVVKAIAEAGGGRVLVAGSGLPVTRLNPAGAWDGTLPTAPFLTADVGLITPSTAGALRLWGTFAGATQQAGYVDLAANEAGFSAPVGLMPRGLAEVFDAQNVGANRILLRGNFTHVNGVARAGLARFSADGGVDESFQAAVAPSAANTGRLALQGDGRILVHTGTALVRLLPDGAADTSFAPFTYSPGDVAVHRDGGILISNGGAGGIFGSKFGVRKLTPGGAVNPGFAVEVTGVVQDLLVQASGRIVLGGQYGSVNGGPANGLVRTLENGYRDPGFSTNSGLGARLVPAAADLAYAVGYTYSNQATGALWRVNANGLDATFSYWSSAQSRYFPAPSALLPLPDGRLLRASPPQPDHPDDPEQHLARHLGNGALDAAFQVHGLDRIRSVIDRMVLVDDGSIWLFGRNLRAAGTRRTGVARLIPGRALTLTAPPVAAQAVPGGSVTLAVTALGSGPIGYQWFCNAMRLPGATNAALTLSNLTVQDGAAYTVTVTNPFGTATTAPVTITGPNPAPAIVQPPASQTAAAGNPAVLAVTATGVGPLAYQWRRCGTPLPGATGATFTIPHASRTDAALYDVVVSDGLSATVSTGARLQVAPAMDPNTLQVDPTFRPKFEAPGGAINAIEPTPEGGFVVSGDFSRIQGGGRPGLARFDASLQLDAGFVPPVEFGEVNVAAWIAVSRAKVLAVLPDGRVLASRALPPVEGHPNRSVLVRLLPTGAVDASFHASAEPENVAQLAVQPDGRLIVLALASSVPAGKRGVYRLNGDGSPDGSFTPSFQMDQVEVAPDCVAVQPDGRVLFGGSFATVNGVASPRLVRLRADGERDASFTVTGFSWIAPRALAVQPDGRVLAGGEFTPSGGLTAYLVRLAAGGDFDGALLQWPATSSVPVDRIAFGDGGRIYASAGAADTSLRIGVWRFSAAGVLERIYNAGSGALPAMAPAGNGRVLVNVNLGEAGRGLTRFGADGEPDGATVPIETTVGVTAAAAAPQGRLYVAGPFSRVNGTPQGGLVRLNADGSRDAGFDPGAGFDLPPGNLLLLPDGGVAASGAFSRYRGAGVSRIVKLLPSGAPDPGFGGETSNTSSGTYGALALLLDGRLLANGSYAFLPDGSRDASYQPAAIGGAGAIPLPDGGVLIGDSSGRRIMRLATDGSVVAAGNVNVNILSGFALQPDGRMVAGGAQSYLNFGTPPTRLLRLTAGFAPDDTFAVTGLPMPSFTTSAYLGPQLLVQEDGRILLNDFYQFGRLDVNGAWDAGFAIPGVKLVRSDPYQAKSAKVFLLQDDGSLLLGDDVLAENGIRRHGLVRLIDAAGPQSVAPPFDQTAVGGDPVLFTMGATSPTAATFQWLKNGAPLAGQTAAALEIPAVTADDAASYSVTITNANGVWRSAGATLTVVPAAAPRIVSQPRPRMVAAGQSATFAVSATGAPVPGYRWLKDGTAIVGATGSTHTIAAVQAEDAAAYSVEVSNRVGTVVSDAARLTLIPGGVVATHAMSRVPFRPGGKVTVTNTLAYPDVASGLTWQVLLPAGWTLSASGGDAGAIKPSPGTNSIAEWTWTAAPPSPVEFHYELSAPASLSGQQEIAALVSLQMTTATAELLAAPDPLILRQHHSADVDRDGRISLLELTRVIELFNIRKGTVRTGSYRPAPGTEDGFGGEPEREVNFAVVLPAYHSADSDANGRISLLELTRVIQLYNYRTSTHRTGEYHIEAGSEDGFATGP